MLFDLQGKRKNVVKVVYGSLAVLMGAGLVLFGVGGAVGGGLLDAFKGGGGGSAGSEEIQKQIDKQEARLRTQPQNEVVLRALVRDYYRLAASEIPENSSTFPAEAQQPLQQASTYWKSYVKVAGKKVDASLAGLAAQLYATNALNQPADAQEAYRVIAERVNNTNAYLQLVAAALAAGDTRTVDLASIKAVDLAPAKQRKAVEKQIKQIKKQAKQQAQAQAGQAAPGGVR